jgi:hypothetical protein
MKTKSIYFKSFDDIIITSPVIRLLAKIFGKKYFVVKCKSCNRYPTEIIERKYCSDCYWEYVE